MNKIHIEEEEYMYIYMWRFANTLGRLDKRMRPIPGPNWNNGVKRIIYKYGLLNAR